MADTKRRSRKRSRRASDAARVALLRVFRAEFSVYYLRRLRERRPGQYDEWKSEAMAAMRDVFRSIEVPTSLTSTAGPGPNCEEGESYVQSMTDAQGNTYTRTCTQYWCDVGDGQMEPDGEVCGPWRPVNPVFGLGAAPILDGDGPAGVASPRVKSEGRARSRKGRGARGRSDGRS